MPGLGLLLVALGQQLVVRLSVRLGLLVPLTLERDMSALALETLGSDLHVRNHSHSRETRDEYAEACGVVSMCECGLVVVGSVQQESMKYLSFNERHVDSSRVFTFLITSTPYTTQPATPPVSPLRVCLREMSDQSLDLGCLEDLLAGLGGDWPPDDVLPDVVLLAQVEQLPDLAGPLGSEPAWLGSLGGGQSLDLLLALLHHHQVQHGQVGRDDAAAGGLALALTSLATPVAQHALSHQYAHPASGEYALCHAEALLVVAAADAEDIAFEVVAERVACNLVRDALVVEGAQLVVVLDLDHLLGARHRVGNVELTRQQHNRESGRRSAGAVDGATIMLRGDIDQWNEIRVDHHRRVL